MFKSEPLKRLPLGMSRLGRLALLSKLKARLRLEVLVIVGALLILLINSGCSTLQTTQPCKPLPPVSMPALAEPLPPVDYSILAAQRIKSWANDLTGTSTTLKP